MAQLARKPTWVSYKCNPFNLTLEEEGWPKTGIVDSKKDIPEVQTAKSTVSAEDDFPMCSRLSTTRIGLNHLTMVISALESLGRPATANEVIDSIWQDSCQGVQEGRLNLNKNSRGEEIWKTSVRAALSGPYFNSEASNGVVHYSLHTAPRATRKRFLYRPYRL